MNIYKTSEVCRDLGGLQCNIACSIGQHRRGGSETRPHKPGALTARQDGACLRPVGFSHNLTARALP